MKNKKQLLKKKSQNSMTSKEMQCIQGGGVDDGVIITPTHR